MKIVKSVAPSILLRVKAFATRPGFALRRKARQDYPDASHVGHLGDIGQAMLALCEPTDK